MIHRCIAGGFVCLSVSAAFWAGRAAGLPIGAEQTSFQELLSNEGHGSVNDITSLAQTGQVVSRHKHRRVGDNLERATSAGFR